MMKSDFLRKILNIFSSVHNFYLNHKVFFFAFFVLFAFIYIFLLNYYTPLLSDDYAYSFIHGTTQRVAGIKDIIRSQHLHYLLWGGRCIALGLAQFFLYLGKPVFNVINTIGYLILTFLIYFHINTSKRINVPLYVIINLLIWFFTPAFGETILWVTGTCVYMWTTIFALAFLLPYRFYSSDPEKFKLNSFPVILLTSILGIIAGWSQENIGGGTVFAVILFLFYLKISKIKIPWWSIIGFFTSLGGYLILLSAPGNFTRAELVHNERSIFVKMLYRGTMITKDLYLNMYFMFFIIAILIVLYFYFNKKQMQSLIKPGIYFFISMGAAYCMALNPGGFPQRAWFGVMIFMYIAMGILYIYLENNSLTLQLKRCSLLFLIIPFCITYYEALTDAMYVDNFVERRIGYILEQKSKGILEIEVTHIVAKSEYNPRYTYDDIDWDENYFGNTGIAHYYGLNSIKAVKEDPYKGFNLSRYPK
ncbi:MAG: DUF6056 family protein [Candidatus Azobacteroides sp.]|nr:DUF6056 family protein [Candidatus Azobacteroides sp.]